MNQENNDLRTRLPGLTNNIHLTQSGDLETVIRRGRGAIVEMLGIDRRSEARVLKQIRHLDIGPELLEMDLSSDTTIFKSIPGTPLDRVVVQDSILVRTLKVLSSLHRQPLAGTPFSSAKLIRRYLSICEVPPQFLEICNRLAGLSEELEEAAEQCLSHNDCVPKNWILQPDGRVSLIDFEFAGANDPAFDLATWRLSFRIERDDPVLSVYEGWDRSIALRVERYLPVVDALWALYCMVLIQHQNHEETRLAARAQLELRLARLYPLPVAVV